MKTLGYYNGKIGELSEMTVPMLDRGCYFGDGIYEATLSRNHIIYALDEHIDRFYRSAAMLDIKIPHTKEELKDILCEMVKKVDDGEQLVYWQATRGTAIRNHVYSDEMKANLWIMLKSAKMGDVNKKVDLITLEDTRFYHCNIKTINLIPSVVAATKAEKAGCHESVLHRGERVTECAHANVHIIKNGIFKTAPTDCLILPGIARAHLIRFCKKNSIPVDETPFTLDELFDADEIIVSSSTSPFLTGATVDGKEVGGKAPEIIEILRREVVEDWLRETDAE